jgi:uncharacterized protein
LSQYLSSQARVEITRASKYLKQLATHFSHKVDVDMGEDCATVRLSYGFFELHTDGENLLVMKTFTDTQEHRERLEHVASSHLLRFAFRDPPDIIWVPIA